MLAIDTRLTYYRRGGISEYMVQLVQALSQLDQKQPYAILHNFRATKSLTPAPNFKRVDCYTPCHHRLEGIAFGLELLPHRFDLLHSPDFIPPRWGAKHTVITVHDLAFLLYPHIQTADSLRYYAGGIRRAVTQADRIIAVSAATKADLIRLLNVPENKISVIWEGLHPQFQVLEEAQITPLLASYALPPDYILFVGTIEPRKNIPTMLQAYALLKSRQPNLPKLVLAGGEGWLAEESFQTILDLKLNEQVIWLGDVPFEVLPALYNRAKVHMLVSLYEGFGFPPLEAMACGTPTIIANRGALPEVAGSAALAVNPDDPEAIADGLERLLNDAALYEELQAKGLNHAKTFTWEVTARQTLAVYEQVLGGWGA